MQLNEYMAFDTGPNNTGTSAIEAVRLKRGVCQDYAHIFIASARSVGVHARFVSGHFFRADGEADQEAGHAWAEPFGPRLVWAGVDPTNGISPPTAHARVARGRQSLVSPP